jgi:type II secretory pathway pseudopilin PulG
MNSRIRPAFTLFQLLVVLALLALLFAMLLPAIAKVRAQAANQRKLNNIRQIMLACHNYHDTYGVLPPGNDANGFSASAKLLPFVEQDNVFKLIDFKKPATDKANAQVRQIVIKLFLSPSDPIQSVNKEAGATNYLFNAGSKPDLADNNGIFYQDSKIKFAHVTDGLSNTIFIGETLKGDGAKKAVDVRRQYVLFDAMVAPKDLKDDAGVKEFKANDHIAGDRGASWIEGKFLYGTFTGTRKPNDEKPDVSCGGKGGLSALRSLDDSVAIGLGDGSARFVNAKKMSLDTWKLLTDRSDGMVIPEY